MSAVVQRRRVHAKVLKLDAKEPNTYEPDTFRYRQYLKTFNDFETNFNKNFLDSNLKGLKTSIANFLRIFKKNELLISDLSKQDQSNDYIFLIQRANNIVRLLADYFLNKRDLILQNKPSHEITQMLAAESQEVCVMTVKTLKVFIMINPVFAKLVAYWPLFVETLLRLTLQSHKLYFKQTLRILEAFLRFNSASITQDMHPLIAELLSTLPKKYFARFSRVIALFLLENTEKTDFKDLSLNYTESKSNKIHSLLLSTPNFLESYVFILESLNQTIKSLTSVNSENLNKTLSYLKDSNLIKNSAVDLRVLKPVFEQCKIVKNLIPEVFASEFIIKFVVSKSNVTEIFFILSSLLAGKRKIDVQNQLNQLDFFTKVIQPFFDILFHPNLQLENPEDSSNASNPLSSARVQLMRIMINFCEGNSSGSDDSKDLFISPEEKMVLSREVILDQTDLNTISQSQSLSKLELLKQNMFEKVENQGLLQKIIALLKKINPNSNYYSWLCSFVETFLKGSNASCQTFVAHTGLLAHLLDQLIRNQITVVKNIQITYDLIAEIFRFNAYNMVFLEKLCKNYGWKQVLLNKVEQSVLNSNVFVRSVILSYEKVCANKKNNSEGEDSLSLFSSLSNRRNQLLRSLVQAVASQAISNDNLCCVNTALTIGVFADQEGNLQASLESLLENKGLSKKSPKETLKEFEKVLDTWYKYYLSNTKGRFVLESATSIKFVYFQDIMEKIQTFLKESI